MVVIWLDFLSMLFVYIIIIIFLLKDVAIAYGFNKIPKTKPASLTQGRQQPLNHISDLIRMEVSAYMFLCCPYLLPFIFQCNKFSYVMTILLSFCYL